MKRVIPFAVILLLIASSVTAYTVFVQRGADPVGLHNTAYYAYQEGNLDAAEAAYLAALALKPEYELAHYNLGLLLFEQRRYSDAHEHFAAALALDDGNAQYHFDYAANYVAMFRQANQASAADFDHAIEHFLAADALQPDYPHAQENALILEEIRDEFFG